MSAALQFYLATVLVYLGVDLIACWGLDLQFGVTGVVNLAFIVFQAAGAYTAAVLTLGPAPRSGGFQQYVLGAHLPFPLPIIAGGVVGGALSALTGAILLRRLRPDLQAITLLIVSVIATEVVTNYPALFDGAQGLSLIPAPLAGRLGLSPTQYQWFYVGLTAVVCLGVYFVVRRITTSPLGRALRSVRENPLNAAAVGRNVAQLRLLTFVLGGAIAGVSGAMLVLFIGAWSPGSWLYPETLVLLAAVIIGGKGNLYGVAIGVVLVPVVFTEAVGFLPSAGSSNFVAAAQSAIIGALLVIFLWFRPQGLLPERRRRFEVGGAEPYGSDLHQLFDQSQ